MAAWGDELRAGRLPDALAREAADAALQAGQERARVEGARRGVRRDAEESGGAARRVRRHSVVARLPLQRVSRAGVSAGRRVRARTARRRRCPSCRVADVRAFSIDDATTTEIDDAFSVRELPNGHYEIGIHIAAPALGIPRGSPLDALARARLSTVYMPGRKITMLPDAVVDAFTLAEGRSPPALSLYAEVAHDGALVRHETRVNRVPVAANLRLDAIGDAFANDLPAPSDPPWTAELRVLWKFAQALSDARGKADFARIDYSFYVDWDARRKAASRSRAHRPASARQPARQARLRAHDLRQQPVGQAARRRAASRASTGRRSNGKVKMSTRPGEHQGLGLAHYLWSSSPLRRYSDLVNQRQLHAAIEGAQAAVRRERRRALRRAHRFRGDVRELRRVPGPDGALLVPALARCRRASTETTGTVIRDTLVRFDRLPLVVRLAGPAGACRRTRACGSRSAASTSSPPRSSADTRERTARRPSADCLDRVDGAARHSGSRRRRPRNSAPSAEARATPNARDCARL